MRPILLALALLAAAPAALPAAAADIRHEEVAFPAGATGTTVRGAITGYDSVAYRFGAEAGQRMTLRLTATNRATYFNVYAPGRGPGDEALAVSGRTDDLVPALNRFDGTLPLSGTYTVSVYMMRSAARRDERSDFRLQIAVTGAPGPVVQGDYADGLQGGPDHWQVRTAGRGLNLRALPSTGAPVAAALASGEVVRNLGCRMAEGRRWCRVARASGDEGWAAGEFLGEAP